MTKEQIIPLNSGDLWHILKSAKIRSADYQHAVNELEKRFDAMHAKLEKLSAMLSQICDHCGDAKRVVCPNCL